MTEQAKNARLWIDELSKISAWDHTGSAWSLQEQQHTPGEEPQERALIMNMQGYSGKPAFCPDFHVLFNEPGVGFDLICMRLLKNHPVPLLIACNIPDIETFLIPFFRLACLSVYASRRTP